MNKSWIKVHTGLTDDPKHRDRMGVRVWLYMRLINMAEYETGVVWFYRDAAMAALMGMPKNTLRTWRRDLEEMKYIKCYPGDQCQHIMIAKWRNPRLVNPPQINVGGWPDSITPPLNKVITPPFIKSITPTLGSQESQEPQGNGDDRPKIFTVWESEMGMLTPSIINELNYWLDIGVSEVWLENAIKIAALRNKRSMAYVNGIMKRYQNEGYDGGVDAQREKNKKPDFVDPWE